ncbi:hypothetical protein DL764_000003 [Monosporascus ibericus]|uniref:Uncharacterized protein n=1 Tax=Monosporascus ibericus TaxID=155417 RepID=A0A4Q4U0K6_9PEZI|nr:hypothetical protein DL764_000003 [Monosporascus ibericus]
MASVNKPFDPKQKDADISRKLQVYGIITAFKNGKVPSNEQIDVALNSFMASKALAHPSGNLSEEGRALVQDFKEVVNQAKLLVLSKNEGNLLQDFIWQTEQFDAKSVNKPGTPVDKDTAKQHGDQAMQGLRTLGTLIITNGQFRKLLKDATILLRDIAGDAATNTASRVRPSEEELASIDEPAQDNTWHDKPNFSKDNVKNQLYGTYKGDPKKDTRDVADSTANAAKRPDGSLDPGAAARTAADRLKEKVPDEKRDETKQRTKQTAHEYRARTKDYLSKKVPEERRDRTIWRLKEAISTLLDLADEYGNHSKRLAAGGSGTMKETRFGLAEAEADLKTLIERCANGTSTDDLWSSIKTIYDDADRDPELKDWFKALNRYIRRCLKEEGYILEEESDRDWNRLYDHGNYLLRDRYRNHTDRIVDEIKFIGDQFDQDPQNKTFAQSVEKLFKDLGTDESGKLAFKPHLLEDLRDVIIPGIMENTAYIPVPRIEYSDSQIDAVIENLVLESDNFMPNVLEVASDNYFRWGRKKVANKNKNNVEIKVTGVQMDLRDVSYYVNRKQGFPSITDTGVANFYLGGDGLSFKMKLSSADPTDRQSFFKVEKVDVDVKRLQIKLVKSNHKMLFGLFKPIMLKVLRPAIQKAAEKQLKDQFNRFDQLLFQIKQEADRAEESAKKDPTNVPNLYKRYVQAAQKRVLQGKKKAQATASDKKVNMAVTKEDSIFPDIHLPGGVSSKATEYKELARRGEKWESPIFSIGTASKSGSIPGAPTITRKQHTVSTGRVNESRADGYSNGNYTNGNTDSRTVNGKLGVPAPPATGSHTVTI